MPAVKLGLLGFFCEEYRRLMMFELRMMVSIDSLPNF